MRYDRAINLTVAATLFVGAVAVIREVQTEVWLRVPDPWPFMMVLWTPAVLMLLLVAVANANLEDGHTVDDRGELERLVDLKHNDALFGRARRIRSRARPSKSVRDMDKLLSQA